MKRFKVWVIHQHERGEGSTIVTACTTPEEAEVKAARLRNGVPEIRTLDVIAVDEIWVEGDDVG